MRLVFFLGFLYCAFAYSKFDAVEDEFRLRNFLPVRSGFAQPSDVSPGHDAFKGKRNDKKTSSSFKNGEYMSQLHDNFRGIPLLTEDNRDTTFLIADPIANLPVPEVQEQRYEETQAIDEATKSNSDAKTLQNPLFAAVEIVTETTFDNENENDDSGAYKHATAAPRFRLSTAKAAENPTLAIFTDTTFGDENENDESIVYKHATASPRFQSSTAKAAENAFSATVETTFGDETEKDDSSVYKHATAAPRFQSSTSKSAENPFSATLAIVTETTVGDENEKDESIVYKHATASPRFQSSTTKAATASPRFQSSTTKAAEENDFKFELAPVAGPTSLAMPNVVKDENLEEGDENLEEGGENYVTSIPQANRSSWTAKVASKTFSNASKKEIVRQSTVSAAGNQFCGARIDGFFRHPDNCSQIIQCFGGEAFEYPPCSNNLGFDEETGACNYRDQVEGCSNANFVLGKATNPSPKVKDLSISPIRDGSNSDSVGSPILDTNGDAASAQLISSQSVVFRSDTNDVVGNGGGENCGEHGDHIAADDCTSFYRCVWDRKVLMNCPPGTVFNPTLDVCDFARNVNCTAVKTKRSLRPFRLFN